MIKDMTEGSPTGIIVAFSLPMLLSMIFQQMYNIVDSVVAGQFVGSSALAAVGASYPVTMLFIAIATGACIGSSVIISQLFGLKDYARMKSSVSTAIITIMGLSVLLLIVGIFICNPLIRLLKTDPLIFDDSAAYLRIYIFGLPFLFLYNAATATYTGLGDSRTPLYFLIFSSVFNIGLDILFVTAFKMGVEGVAWATFIAQGISSVLAAVCLVFKLKKIKTEKFKLYDLNLLKKITVVAVPSICQQSFISVGQLCVQGLVNSYGYVVTAGYSAALKVNILAVSCYNTMSSALSSFTAQNIGAGKPERVKTGFRSTIVMSLGIMAVFVLAFCLFGKNLIGLFVGEADGAEVVRIGRMFLWTVCAGYPFVMVKVVVDGVLRGAGDMTAFMISTFSDLVVRVAVSFILAPSLGFFGICLSYPIGWVLGMVVSVIFYASGRWKNKKKV